MADLQRQLAELKERYGADNFTVDELDDDDPILRTVDGTIVDTWREGYPYEERIADDVYEGEKRLLQIELLKLQKWIQASGAAGASLFEGRDAAGKGGTIKRFMEHLNPAARARRSRWRSPPTTSAGSGISSATSSTCRRPARWSCSTAPGTPGPASSG